MLSLAFKKGQRTISTNPHLLALHVAVGLESARHGIDRQADESRIAPALGGVDGERPGQKQDAHDREAGELLAGYGTYRF